MDTPSLLAAWRDDNGDNVYFDNGIDVMVVFCNGIVDRAPESGCVDLGVDGVIFPGLGLQMMMQALSTFRSQPQGQGQA